MAQPLHSKHFTNRPPEQVARLNQCGTADLYHIMPGETGLHVGAIQQALRIIGSKASTVKALAPIAALKPPMPYVSDQDFDAGFYGKSTQDAVTAYKNAFHILRPGQAKADNIVGIMTISWLDDHMTAIEGKTVPTHRILRQDVVVMFPGGSDDLQGTEDTGRIRAMRTHLEQKINQQAPRYRDNFIFPPAVIAYYGADRDAATNKVRHVFSLIQSLFATAARMGVMPGRIVIFGSSFGGYNAMQLAVMLTSAGRSIRFMRLGDTAFRPSDTHRKTKTSDGRDVPEFYPPGNMALNESANSFQTRGNELGGRIVGVPELHGSVMGMHPDDVSNITSITNAWNQWDKKGRPSGEKPTLFNNMHDRAVENAEGKFFDDAPQILVGLR